MHEVYFDEHMLLPENERFINGIAVQIYKFMYEGKIPPSQEEQVLATSYALLAKAVNRMTKDFALLQAVCPFGMLPGAMNYIKTRKAKG